MIMNRSRIRTLLLAALLLAVGIGSAGVVAAQEVVVTGDGELQMLLTGAYGELFPDGDEAPAEANVLALDIVQSDGSLRLLVPTTESQSVEESPTLYHDSDGTTFILWASRLNGVHPYLRLARWSGGWNGVLDIEGSVFAEKFSPQLNVHHEIWTGDDGETVERSVFTVLWWEYAGDRIEKRTKLLVLENGDFVGASQILTLGSLASDLDEIFDPSSLDQALRIQGTDNGFFAGFVGGRTGRLEILEFSVQNMELSRLAAIVEDAIRDFDVWGPETLEDFVARVILENGTKFHPGMLNALIDSILQLIGELDGDLEAVGDKAMPHIIHQGARFKTGGLLGAEPYTVSIESNSDAFLRQHHVAVVPVASWELPEMGDGTQLFISRRGTAALLAWNDGDFVAYRETTAEGWSDANLLDVTKGIDRETAYRILEERTLER